MENSGLFWTGTEYSYVEISEFDYGNTCNYSGTSKLSIHKIMYNGRNSATIDNLLNRNDHEYYGCTSWTATNDQGYSTAFLKKMPIGFQTVGFSDQNASETNSSKYSIFIPANTLRMRLFVFFSKSSENPNNDFWSCACVSFKKKSLISTGLL